MIVVLCERRRRRRRSSHFTAELDTHSKWCSTIYLRNQICRLGTIDINLFTLKWKTQIFKNEIKRSRSCRRNHQDGIWANDEEHHLLYLFSSEMKRTRRRREGQQRERKKEREQYYIFLSLCLSFINNERKGRRRDSTAEQLVPWEQKKIIFNG